MHNAELRRTAQGAKISRHKFSYDTPHMVKDQNFLKSFLP